MRKLIATFLCVGVSGAALAAEEGREAERLEKAAEVVNEIMGMPEGGIPRDLFNKAVCVGVVPSAKKAALGVGASFGRGAAVCRQGGTGTWGAPSMFTVGGPNFGFQLGGQATDFVVLVMNAKGAQKLLQSKVKLGADASVAGGPVGRTAEAATDAQLHAEMLTYSRSRGLFAGLSLDGQVVKQDNDANERLYGRKVDPKDILFRGTVPSPAEAAPLDAALMKYSPHGGEKFLLTEAAHESPPASAAAPAQPAAPSAGPSASAREEFASLTVKSTPDGADIMVDGKFVGNTPSTLKLSPGDHTVSVAARGCKSWQRTVALASGSSITLNATLEKAQ
jgi:lipid-binding SYLF domain-containing protein